MMSTSNMCKRVQNEAEKKEAHLKEHKDIFKREKKLRVKVPLKNLTSMHKNNDISTHFLTEELTLSLVKHH